VTFAPVHLEVFLQIHTCPYPEYLNRISDTYETIELELAKRGLIWYDNKEKRWHTTTVGAKMADTLCNLLEQGI
jgi:hypothetical protein